MTKTFLRIPDRITLHLLIGALILLLGTTSASATVIGPGAGIANATLFDDPGVRLNIDRNSFVALGPGTYSVLSAAFNFGGEDGNESSTRDPDPFDDWVVPFLAIQTADGGATLTFEAIWVGGQIFPSSPTASGIETTLYAGEAFALAAVANIYAGFWQGDNLVNFASGGLTAHDSPFFLPDFSVTAPTEGASLTGFSHPDLGPPSPRTYAYEITIGVPEPAALALLGIALIGLGFLRRRN